MNSKILVIIIALLIVVGGAYYACTQKNLVTHTVPVTPTATETVILTPSLPAGSGQASTPTSATTIDETEVLKVTIKQQIVAEHGSDANGLTISVSKIEGNFAQGGASEQGGGGMWFAAKVGEQWKLVWDGNGTISCETIAPYNFPTDMIPECWNNTTQKSVTR